MGHGVQIVLGSGILLQLCLLAMIVWSFPRVVAEWNREVRRGRNSLLSSTELRQLLTRILQRSVPYEVLRRLTVVMPLVGVLLTWWKFGEVAGGDSQLSVMLSSSQNLFHGVASGAVLAMVNQLMLVLVHYCWERYCGSVDLPEDVTSITAATAVFSAGLRDALRETVARCDSLVTGMQASIRDRSDVVDQLLQQTMESQRQLAQQISEDFRTRMDEAVRSATEQAADLVQRGHQQCVQSQQQYRQSIQANLQLQEATSASLQQSRAGSESLTQIAQALNDTARQVTQVCGQLDVGTVRDVGRAVDLLTGTLDQLQQQTDASRAELQRSVDRCRGLEEGLSAAETNLGDATVTLSQSVAAFTARCEAAEKRILKTVRRVEQSLWQAAAEFSLEPDRGDVVVMSEHSDRSASTAERVPG
jgi:flagellar biosynthesis/type III secretory pathway protein FliH